MVDEEQKQTKEEEEKVGPAQEGSDASLPLHAGHLVPLLIDAKNI